MRRTLIRSLTAVLTVTPSLALAHSGDHTRSGATHALTAPDHLSALVALAVVVGLLAYALARR